MPNGCEVVLIALSLIGQSAGISRFPTHPLGFITVAALLSQSWQCRLVHLNIGPAKRRRRRGSPILTTP